MLLVIAYSKFDKKHLAKINKIYCVNITTWYTKNYDISLILFDNITSQAAYIAAINNFNNVYYE